IAIMGKSATTAACPRPWTASNVRVILRAVAACFVSTTQRVSPSAEAVLPGGSEVCNRLQVHVLAAAVARGSRSLRGSVGSGCNRRPPAPGLRLVRRGPRVHGLRPGCRPRSAGEPTRRGAAFHQSQPLPAIILRGVPHPSCCRDLTLLPSPV